MNWKSKHPTAKCKVNRRPRIQQGWLVETWICLFCKKNRCWGPEIVLVIYTWLVLLFGVIICDFSFYSMVNTINQVQIHRFESKWLRNPNRKNDEGFIFSSHATNQAKDNFSQSTKNAFVDSKLNCIYWCLTLLAYLKDK